MPCETEETTAQPEQVKLDLPEGVPPLSSLYIYASGSCNLACRHCWIVPEYLSTEVGSEDGKHVPLECVTKAIREGKTVGLGSAKLTGGEPTLHPQFRELVTLLAEAGLGITIETNGTLVDDDLAAFLKATPQVSFISVSLDGVDAETHDALRGVHGSHERAINGIQSLVKAGFHPQIICTLHKGNVAQLDDMVALAEELGCGSIKFNLVQEMGRGQEFAGQHGLSMTEILALNQHVERELAPQSKVRIFFDIPFAFRPLSRLLKGDMGRCGVLGILGLLSGGELSLCGVGTTIPELIYGHIAQDNLRDVWCESPGLVLLREQIPAQLEGICAECLHRDLCLGSCIANNYHAAGQLNAAYMFCDRAEAAGLFPASRKRST
ncbi:MAG: radical SAM protein [Chloroflexi bacterium]|nr:radical SAM protein [Chloroflexota bacterium]MBU1748021.1 radical SAM protein [Chloroflexota bacterium]MBU1877322.1 radical SAM protein [Chloroflexota bacterium]